MKQEILDLIIKVLTSDPTHERIKLAAENKDLEFLANYYETPLTEIYQKHNKLINSKSRKFLCHECGKSVSSKVAKQVQKKWHETDHNIIPMSCADYVDSKPKKPHNEPLDDQFILCRGCLDKDAKYEDWIREVNVGARWAD